MTEDQRFQNNYWFAPRAINKMQANLAVSEWDISVRHGVNADGKTTLQGGCRAAFSSPVQVQIAWVILGCQFNAAGVFHCHHGSSEPAQPLMGVGSKPKKTCQSGGVVYIRYPVSDLTDLPEPRS